MTHFHTEGPAPHLAPEMAGHFRHKAWGVAELHDRTVAERARALIGIAHPDFRDEMTTRARMAYYL